MSLLYHDSDPTPETWDPGLPEFEEHWRMILAPEPGVQKYATRDNGGVGFVAFVAQRDDGKHLVDASVVDPRGASLSSRIWKRGAYQMRRQTTWAAPVGRRDG